MRRLVVMLLAFGVFLTGTVDAIACEPLFEEASHSASAAHESGGEESTPSSEKHGLCTHGHCHHGAQLVQAGAAEETVPLLVSDFRPELAGPLRSSHLGSLKRPPRI